MAINGKYNVEERKLRHQVLVWKNKQKVLRDQWLVLDIKINALENKIKDMVLNRTNKKKKKNP